MGYRRECETFLFLLGLAKYFSEDLPSDMLHGHQELTFSDLINLLILDACEASFEQALLE